MVYEIQPYIYNQDKKLGVEIKPSTNKKKKIDVFKSGQKVASIGAAGMSDYPTYMKEKGIEYAKERQRLYKARHSKDKGIAGQLASKILW